MKHPDNLWSLDDVVQRAARQGEKLGRSNLDKLRKEPPKSLTRSTIFGLAAGLGVTPLTVANAALESMDIPTRPAETTDAVETVKIDPTLGDADRRQLIALINEMRATASDKRLFDEENALAAEVTRRGLDTVLFDVAAWAREKAKMDRRLFTDRFTQLLRAGEVSTAEQVIDRLKNWPEGSGTNNPQVRASPSDEAVVSELENRFGPEQLDRRDDRTQKFR